MPKDTRLRPIAQVNSLSLSYFTDLAWLDVLVAVSFEIAPGEIVGMVGESGCGKSTVAQCLIGQVARNARITQGFVQVADRDVLAISERALSDMRGRRVSFVPQNPTTSLAPHLRIEGQIVEMLLRHRAVASRGAARKRAAELLELVGLPSTDRLALRYPHQLSGGQQQRVCIALALACEPDLIILDEPTTGLDVTTQSQIVDTLLELRERTGTAMFYVTHDLALLSQVADRVVVMYAGNVVEVAPTGRLFEAPSHPYTRALIAASPDIFAERRSGERLEGILRRSELPEEGCSFAPRCPHAHSSCLLTRPGLEPIDVDHQVACIRANDLSPPAAATPPSVARPTFPQDSGIILKLDDVTLAYEPPVPLLLRPIIKSSPVEVVRDVSFTLRRGEMISIVGESGSGKTTIARAIAGLLPPVKGRIFFDDAPLEPRIADRGVTAKRAIQYVFQNPDMSLNPRATVRGALMRPVEVLGAATSDSVENLLRQALNDVRLDESYLRRRPTQLSGGEKQRVAIARALIVGPSLMISDEILSALDVSVQARMIELLQELKIKKQVSSVFISHDLAVVREISDQVIVLYRGEVMEIGPADVVFRPPYHPYTADLLIAAPSIARKRQGAELPIQHTSLAGQGCRYFHRCKWAIKGLCNTERPPLESLSGGGSVRCHLPETELEQAWSVLQRVER